MVVAQSCIAWHRVKTHENEIAQETKKSLRRLGCTSQTFAPPDARTHSTLSARPFSRSARPDCCATTLTKPAVRTRRKETGAAPNNQCTEINTQHRSENRTQSKSTHTYLPRAQLWPDSSSTAARCRSVTAPVHRGSTKRSPKHQTTRTSKHDQGCADLGVQRSKKRECVLCS